jgi:ParB/RepB/Spo0J family partition protein
MTKKHAPLKLVDIPIAKIDRPTYGFRSQPTGGFLAQSLKQYGFVSPILVRPKGHGRFELIYGAQRLVAAKAAKEETVPALVRKTADKDTLIISVIENLVRRNLDELEQAKAFRKIQKMGYTPLEISKLLGLGLTTVRETLSLLQLPAIIQRFISQGKLKATIGEMIARKVPRKDQLSVAQTMIKTNPSILGAQAMLEGMKEQFRLEKLAEEAQLDKKENKPEGSRKVAVEQTQEEKEAIRQKLEEAISGSRVNLVTLRTWKLLLKADPLLKIHARLYVDRASLLWAMERDVAELKAKEKQETVSPVPVQS